MDRRLFLKQCVAGTVALPAISTGCGLRAGVADPSAAGIEKINFPDAFRLARQYGLGTASLEGPVAAEAGGYGTWTVVFKAGKAGVRPGGGIRIGLRHLNSGWSAVQDKDPAQDGFLSVESPPHAPGRVLVACQDWGPFFPHYFPFQNIVEVLVAGDGLRPGETLRVTYGDRRRGSRGYKLQPFSEKRYRFMPYVDAWGQGAFLPIEGPTLRITPGPATRLTSILPSDAVRGKPTWCAVRAEDRFGNAAETYRGRVSLSASGEAAIPSPHVFAEADGGVFRFDGIVFPTEGPRRILAEDGQRSARSNPVVVHGESPSRRLLWGDLHGHTESSDGRGSPAEYYDHARRVAALDFAAITDHDFELTNDDWTEVKKATNAAYRPSEFTTIHGYEWSGTTDRGGDHNVYSLDEDLPVYRSAWDGPGNFQWSHEAPQAPDVQSLYVLLLRHKKGKNLLVIPHWGGRSANPRWHDPELERLIEASSEHVRSFAWAETFLNRGYRLGLMASGDSHFGHPGYGYLGSDQFKRGLTGEGLVAVLAEENTRPSVFTALYDRHCYATTGDRIILDFRVNGALMGAEIRAAAAPSMTVKAIGTTPIRRVEILKNTRVVHAKEPHCEAVELTWQDPDFTAGTPVSYSVRLIQENDEQAWSSPVWVES